MVDQLLIDVVAGLEPDLRAQTADDLERARYGIDPDGMVHVQVRDDDGTRWTMCSFSASWAPTDRPYPGRNR